MPNPLKQMAQGNPVGGGPVYNSTLDPQALGRGAEYAKSLIPTISETAVAEFTKKIEGVKAFSIKQDTMFFWNERSGKFLLYGSEKPSGTPLVEFRPAKNSKVRWWNWEAIDVASGKLLAVIIAESSANAPTSYTVYAHGGRAIGFAVLQSSFTKYGPNWTAVLAKDSKHQVYDYPVDFCDSNYNKPNKLGWNLNLTRKGADASGKEVHVTIGDFFSYISAGYGYKIGSDDMDKFAMVMMAPIFALILKKRTEAMSALNRSMTTGGGF